MTQKPLLLLDAGNSAVKWLLLDGDEQRRGTSRPGGDARELDLASGAARALIASVADDETNEALAAALKERGCEVWFAHSRAHAGDLVNSYAEPARMGVDRWLAMLAARRRCRGRFCVADAGSALTIDLVAADGRHEGGYIIPGTTLMRQALFADTRRVRFDAAPTPDLSPGRSTAEAVEHGLLLAQCGAVERALELAAGSGPKPELLLCGGAAPVLQAALTRPAQVLPDLVFEGLLLQAGFDGVLDLRFSYPLLKTESDF